METKAPSFLFFKGSACGEAQQAAELSWAPGAQEITYSTASSPGGVSPTAPPAQLPEVVFPTAPEERQTTRLSLPTFYTPRVTS